MDKRKEKRFTTQLHVKVHADSRTAWGILGDISENGLFIKTNRAINLNSVIDIEIFMPDSRNSHLKGIVTRTVDLADAHRQYGLGVQLTKKDIKYRLFLEPYLYQPEPDNAKIGA